MNVASIGNISIATPSLFLGTSLGTYPFPVSTVISAWKLPPSAIVQINQSGLTILTPAGNSISLANTGPGLSISILKTCGSADSVLIDKPLKFNNTSTTSSNTPGIAVYSCVIPSILADVTAVPSRLDNNTRLRELPIVIPNPLSNGLITNLPYCEPSELVAVLTVLIFNSIFFSPISLF